MLNEKGERELVYVAKVTDIKPIEGADKVELAYINGWHVMVRKGQFEVGDLCVYFEIDSLLPCTNDAFSFMEKYHYKVKTQKYFKGTVISQGLIMTLEELGLKEDEIKEGVFLTERLGVKYYEPEDNERKADGKKLIQMRFEKLMSRWEKKHPKISKIKLFRKLKEWSIKRLLREEQKKKSGNSKWPVGLFPGVTKTDQERCLFKETKVITTAGLKRIADIVNKKLNVQVLSYDSSTNALGYKDIVGYQRIPYSGKMLKIKVPYTLGAEMREKPIDCTPDHKFFTPGGYVEAKDLSLSDFVYIPSYTYLDDSIMEFLYGNILGDGRLYREGNRIRFNFGQAEARKNYVYTLQRLYGGSDIYYDKGGYAPNVRIYKFTLTDTDLLTYYIMKDGLFEKDKKHWELTESFCNRLTWKSLATWFMDDGSYSYSAEPGKTYTALNLHTEGYSLEENNLLIKTLKEKFNIEATLQEQNNKHKKYLYLRIRNTSIPLFMKNVAPYITEDLKYKLDPEFRNVPSVLDNITFEKGLRLLPVPIKSITEYSYNDSVYDITVADNHNFFAGNVLTHNCENMPYILKDKEPYTKTTKVDGTSSTYILQRIKKNKFEYYVCSRNVRMMDEKQKNFHSDSENVYWQVSDKYKIREFLEFLLDYYQVDWVSLQGETAGQSLSGVKIQGDPHQLKDLRFFGFHLKTPKGMVNIEEAQKICNEHGIDWVPIIDTNYILPDDMEEFKLSADGPCEIPGSAGLREGYVYYKNSDPTASFKNVSREYLLSKKD